SGFYVCPNHLAGLLEVLGIFGLSIACWSRWPVWSKLLVGYAVALCYVGLVLTGSRGGYLSAGASLLVFALLSLLTLRQTTTGLFWKISIPAAVAAIVAGALLVHVMGKSQLLSARAQNTFETSNMRVDLWQGALQQWKLNPIFGTGSATYLYYGRMFRTERVQGDPVYVHNDYLQLLAEYGAIGVAVIALFTGAHLSRGFRSFRRLGPKRVAVSPRLLSNALALNLGAIAAVCSYLVHSALDFNLHIPANLLLMAFVFGLLANEGVSRESSSPAPPDRQWIWKLALAGLSLLLLVQCVRLIPGEYFAERARAALRDEQPVAATYFARRGLEHDESNPDLSFYLGLARTENAERMTDPQAKASFYREAITAFERARAIIPQENLYALELASALDAQQRYDEAESVFHEALELDPRSAALRRYYERHLKRSRGEPPDGSEPEAAKP
ncbi:MAG: O-antigen ligase family protein, partial [Verrucomicrobiota bacterium]|nr:O-antigen ligase family protein [Verrucomicrobiota bacterium]